MEPAAILVASPWLPLALLTLATALWEELHCTEVATSWVVPSLKTPVASNCAVVPIAIADVMGVTVIDTRVAGVTVKVSEPLKPAAVAVMVVCPVFTPLAMPCVLTVATEIAVEAQAADVVKLSVLPSA